MSQQTPPARLPGKPLTPSRAASPTPRNGSGAKKAEAVDRRRVPEGSSHPTRARSGTAASLGSRVARGAGGTAAKLAKAKHVGATVRSGGEKKSVKADLGDALTSTAGGAVKGAVAGGGAASAVVGGLKGLGSAAVDSSRGRKILVAVVVLALALPLLPAALLAGILAVAVSSAEEESVQHNSSDAVTESTGMSLEQKNYLFSITAETNVPWQVMAALVGPSAGTATDGGSDASAPGGMDCSPSGSSAEDGLSDAALLVLRCGAEQFEQVTTFGGVAERANNRGSDHPAGRAVDAMIPGWDTTSGNELGWRVADWYVENASALDVNYVIFDSRIWTGGEGWSDYTHPSGGHGPNLDHTNHVHVSVNDASAAGGPAATTTGVRGEGMGPFSLSEASGLTQEEASDFRTAATYLVAELKELLAAAENHRYGLALSTGVAQMDDGTLTLAVAGDHATGADGEFIDSDAARAAKEVQDAYVAALTQAPIAGMDENQAQRVFSTARDWYMGVVTASTSGGTGGPVACQVSRSGELTELTVRGATGSQFTFTTAQVSNAAVVIGAGEDAGVGRRGTLVALITTLAESTLRNLASDGSDPRLSAHDALVVARSLDYPNDGIGSDWDSIGLFQQRPSQGWGTPEEIMDPTYAAGTFYDRLEQVDDWQDMRPGTAAQAVQRSAFPSAYDPWLPVAEQLADRVDSASCSDGVEFSPEGWTNPLPGSTITSGFDLSRVHPVTGQVMPHYGTDLATSRSSPVLAAQDGVVVKTSGCQSGCMDPDYWVSGFFVAIEHGGGVVTTYNHMTSDIEVTPGQRVSAGDTVGHVGMSGQTTGPHLHFQVLTGVHEFANPTDFMAGVGIPLGQRSDDEE